SVSLNHESVELRFVEQIVDHEQTNLLGLLLRQLEGNYFNGKKPLTACVEELYLKLSSYGFSAIADRSDADDRPTPSNHFESADRSGSAGRSGVSGSPGFGQIPGNVSPAMSGKVVRAFNVNDKWTKTKGKGAVSDMNVPSDHRPMLVEFNF
ncbi:MAG: hypothetical protein IKH11_07960, partial [Bacteroidales bacterium]|nr:hypothetical protein [Bacteroidales bacterium]